MTMVNSLQKEIQQIRLDMESLVDKKAKKLINAYLDGIDQVNKEMSVIYAKYTKNGDLSISTTKRLAIIKSLQKQYLVEIKNMLGKLDEQIASEILEEVYKESRYRSIYALDKGIDTIIAFDKINPDMIESAVFKEYKGELFSDRIWTNKEKLLKRLKKQINYGLMRGQSINKMAKGITKVFNSSIHESERLIRTEMSRLINEVQSDIYKDSGVVRYVMYDATLDTRTSTICQGYDGDKYPVTSDYPKPPQHPNCRSCLIPMVEGWNPTTRKDNITKQNIDYTTYESWLKSRIN